jgi:hypothetical protein
MAAEHKASAGTYPLADDDEYNTGAAEQWSQLQHTNDDVITYHQTDAAQPQKRRKSAPPKSLSSSNQCISYMLIIGNGVLFMISCAVIGLGIYVIVDKANIVVGVFGSVPLIAPACYLVLASGCLLFVASFIGCISALAANKPALLLYSSLMALIVLMSIVGFVLAIVFRSKVNERARQYMRDTLLTEYGVKLENDQNRKITSAWNSAQWKWYCCSVDTDSWSLYKSSEWYGAQSSQTELLKPLVPESCCVRNQYNDYVDKEKCQTWPLGPPTVHSSVRNEALFSRGCYEAGKKVVYDISKFIFGITVTLIVLSIGAIVLAMMLALTI